MDKRLCLVWGIICLWIACSYGFHVGNGPPFFDQPPPPMPVDKDYDDMRDLTPMEKQALKELRAIKRSRSIIRDFKLPKCNFKKWNRLRCCLSFKWMERKKKFCLKTAIRLKKVTVYIALIMNRMPLLEHEIALTEFCAGIPHLKKLSACIHIYHLDLKFKPKFKFKACAQITIAGIFSLQFNCIIIDAGGVKFDHSVEPEDKGIFALNFKDGKLVFEFNNPIPPELIEMVKEFAQVVKKKVVVFVNTVVDTVKKVWNAFKCWFWSC